MRKDKRRIPKGFYCYSCKTRRSCPYWSKRHDKPKMNNGYCAYLGQGDWDLNRVKNWRKIYAKGKKRKGKREPWQSAYEMGFYLSLLWDQVKACGIREDLTAEDQKALR